jgi:hypothetical protein
LIEIFEEEKGETDKENNDLKSALKSCQETCQTWQIKFKELENNLNQQSLTPTLNLESKLKNLEINLHESLKKIEILTTQNNNLNSTNQILINKIQNLQNMNESLNKEKEYFKQKMFDLESKGKENSNGMNSQNQPNLQKMTKISCMDWDIEMISEANIFKILKEKRTRNMENDLSFLLNNDQMENSNNDLYIPKYEHEEKLNLEILKLKKQHLKQNAQNNQEKNKVIQEMKSQIESEIQRSNQLVVQLKNKDLSIQRLQEVKQGQFLD